jgi:hypothetical protein
LARAENELALLPAWLSFLTRIKSIRAINGFATQYWFYAQIYALGRTGATAPECSVFAALNEVESTHKNWLRAHRR